MDGQKILILEFRSLVTCGEGVRHPTMLVKRKSFVFWKIHNFQTLAIENKLLALSFWGVKCVGL